MKRVIVAALGMMSVAGTLHAQGPAPARRPRVGYAASPTPPEQPAPVQVVQPQYYYGNGGYIIGNGGYIITGAPYLALNDGSVLVNFGNGYERVLRPCARVQPAAPADPWARDALGRIPEPPGIAALRAGTRGQLGGTMPASNVGACYRADRTGRAEVVRN